MLQVSNIINVLIENLSRRVNQLRKEKRSDKQANTAIYGDSRCKMFYITTLTCTSGDLSTVYRTSQDTTAGWHRCYTPRVRRNSMDHRLLPGPGSSSVPAEELQNNDAHRIVTPRWLNQGGFVGRRFVPIPDNHCVQ